MILVQNHRLQLSGNRLKGVTGIVLGLFLLGSVVYAQKKRAIKEWERGLESFRNKAFLTAVQHFKEILGDATYGEKAMYMVGLSYYYAKQYDLAHDYFQQFTQRYAGSDLVRWAQYHRALCLIESGRQIEGGLYILRTLLEEPLPPSLKMRIENAIQYFCYHRFDLSFLKSYKEKCHPLLRSWVYEAYFYKLYQEEKRADQKFDRLIKEMREYKAKYGEFTFNLKKLWYVVHQSSREGVRLFEIPDTFRVALVLPFYGVGGDTTLEARSYPALWFYEGFLLGLEESYSHLPPIQIKVIDTWGDPAFCENTVITKLDRFKPHLVIGGMFKTETEPIAQYCHRKKILHLVPFLTTSSFMKKSEYTFYLNPTLPTQYKTLISYAILEESKEHAKVKVYVLYENSESEATKGIEEGIEELKDSISIVVKYEELPWSDSLFYRYCSRYIQNALNEGVHIIAFISPVEHRIEHFLSALSRLNYRLQFKKLIGHESWFFYPNLNRQSLEVHNTIIYSGYYEGNDSVLVEKFRNQYGNHYFDLPNFYAYQGYETARVILKAWERVESWESWQDLFRKFQPLKGLCQNFYWGRERDNQSVQILRYHLGAFQRLFLWKAK